MKMVQTELLKWGYGIQQAVTSGITSLWESFLAVFPGFLGALVILAIGWVVAVALARVVRIFLEKAKLDKWLAEQGLSRALGKAKLSLILSTILKWYVFLVFAGESVSLIKLVALTEFLQRLVFYLPSLIGASVAIIAGLLTGEYVKNNIVETKLIHKELFGQGAKWLVVYLALVVGLETAGLKVAILVEAFRIFLMTIAAILAIGLGLALGLALKDKAKEWSRDLEKLFKR